MRSKAGDRACTLGVTQERNDETKNGQRIVTQEKRLREDQPRAVSCDSMGEQTCVQPSTLIMVASSSRRKPVGGPCDLHPTVGEALESIVLEKVGDGHACHIHHGDDDLYDKKVRGQVTRTAFDKTVRTACELYDISETDMKAVVEMVYNFIGKDGDAKLLSVALHEEIRRMRRDRSPLLTQVQDVYAMRTPAEISDFMSKARKGTLAHIQSQQMLLKRVIPRVKDFFDADHREASTVAKLLMCDADDSKSIRVSRLKEELIAAGMCGEVMVHDSIASTIKRVPIDETLHKTYVNWLAHSVVPTLDPMDAKRRGSSLMRWYSIPKWEQYLISSIILSADDERIVFIFDNDKRNEGKSKGRESWLLDLWLRGFTSLDVSSLADAPGIHVDRRIVRLAFFAELIWNESLRTGAWDKLRRITAVDSSSHNDSDVKRCSILGCADAPTATVDDERDNPTGVRRSPSSLDEQRVPAPPSSSSLAHEKQSTELVVETGTAALLLNPTAGGKSNNDNGKKSTGTRTIVTSETMTIEMDDNDGEFNNPNRNRTLLSLSMRKALAATGCLFPTKNYEYQRANS